MASSHPATHSFAVVAILTAFVALIYAQVRTHEFVFFDDFLYVAKNEHVLQGLTWSGIVWAFTHLHAMYWLPLTWISHMIDVQLFGRDAGAHLLVNAVLHAVNCSLLFFFLKRATERFWESAIVAALFAVHPLHVESVAWVSERKDTLSTLFFLLCLLAYARYVADRSRFAYIGSFIALALGLMAKPMLVTTPFVLLLLDYWPFRRFGTVPVRQLLLEKVPHALCVLAMSAATLLAQQRAMATTSSLPLIARLANAMTSYAAYLGKTFWPARLAVFYPFPTHINPVAAVLAAAFLIVVSGIVFWFRRELPPLFVGWFWFVGTLVPVIGIFQAGQQAYADRFTYLPHIGLFIGIVWTVSMLLERRSTLVKPALAIACVVICGFAAVAHAQVKHWQSTITLFQHALDATSNDNKLAHVDLAGGLLTAGDYVGAEREYRAAMGYQPADILYDGLALALIGQGRLDEATAAAQTAVKANPSSAPALGTLGAVELARGNAAEAQKALARSLEIEKDPTVEARLALSRGEYDVARTGFQAAVAANPFDADLRNDYAATLARTGNDADAETQYDEALRINPNLYDARMNYGALLSRIGRNSDAAQQFDAAARLRPQSPEPHIYLALLQSNEHRFADAAANIQQAMAINHDVSNRILIDAIRIQPRATAIDEYLAFLRRQSGGR